MSYAEDLKNKLNNNSGSISAVIYARVSTDNDGQKDSCSNQVELAKKYVDNHPNIKILNIFIDDGISGKNDFTRPQYNAMLNLISENNVDLIITKSLSRLNRDQINSLILKNFLVEHKATILTLEDFQIHDFEDLGSELIHSINFAIDAQYVKRQSINGKKTQELRCARKELSAKDCQTFGYIWNNNLKTITINEKEAEIVRKIFEDYVFYNGTPASIQKTLKMEGIYKSAHTISNMIADERYIGNFYINKQTTILGTGQTKSKKIKLPKEQWVLVLKPELQIVDLDIFEMAQRIHKTRITIYDKPDKKATQARFQGTHKFAGKIFCPVCKKPYHFIYSDRAKTKPIYVIKSHSDCTNPIHKISEFDLEEITRQALKKTISQQNEICESIETILIECISSKPNNENEICKLKKQINSKENQIDSLIVALSEGGLTEISMNRIKEKINTLTEQLDNIEKLIKDKQKNNINITQIPNQISKIKSAISELRKFNKIDRNKILNYIDKIELPATGDINIYLKSAQIINIQAIDNCDLFVQNNVVKMLKQDGPYSAPESYQSPHFLSPLPR